MFVSSWPETNPLPDTRILNFILRSQIQGKVRGQEMLLEGRVALVTGGSGGLGRVDALALAEAGADVVVADIVMEGAEKTSQEIRARGRRSLAIQMDVTKKDEVKEGTARVKKELGSIDILVNSAATIDHRGQILEYFQIIAISRYYDCDWLIALREV